MKEAKEILKLLKEAEREIERRWKLLKFRIYELEDEIMDMEETQ